MDDDKILEVEDDDEEPKSFTDRLNEILPLDSVAAALGVFFAICSAAYVIIRTNVSDANVMMALAIAAVITFLLMWVTFCFIAWWKRKAKAKALLIKRKEQLVKQLHFCKDCSLKKMNDGFAYRQLLRQDNIDGVEKSLRKDADPKQCNVLIYTSDLATLIRRLDLIRENIEEYEIKYHVVYFNDNSDKYHDEIVNLIGEENLLFADDVKALKNSKDRDFFTLGDLELIIYLDSFSYIQGFLSVDNVPINAIDVGRDAHFDECSNRCNYGYSYGDGIVEKTPFYKAINKEKARTLYKQIDKCFKGGERHE